MEKRFVVLSVSVLLVLCIPVVLLLSNSLAVVFDFSYYQREFSGLNVYSSVPDADLIAGNLLSFFSGSALQPSRFNEREVSHLYDVRNLVSRLEFLFFGVLLAALLFAVFLFFLSSRDFVCNLFRALAVGSSLTILLIALLFVFSRNFYFIFADFHKVFFAEGSWVFERGALLVTVFPEQFFYDAFSRVVLNSALQSFVILLLVFVFCRKCLFEENKFAFFRRGIFGNERYLNGLPCKCKLIKQKLKEVVILAKKKAKTTKKKSAKKRR